VGKNKVCPCLCQRLHWLRSPTARFAQQPHSSVVIVLFRLPPILWHRQHSSARSRLNSTEQHNVALLIIHSIIHVATAACHAQRPEQHSLLLHSLRLALDGALPALRPEPQEEQDACMNQADRAEEARPELTCCKIGAFAAALRAIAQSYCANTAHTRCRTCRQRPNTKEFYPAAAETMNHLHPSRIQLARLIEGLHDITSTPQCMLKVHLHHCMLSRSPQSAAPAAVAP
jgi:hypothetical protein